MYHIHRATTIAIFTTLFFMGLVPAKGIAAGVFELQIDDGLLSIKADKVPLQELLYRLRDYGITVRVDPAINPPVSASFTRKDLQQGLKSILRAYNSVFIWRQREDASASTGGPGYYLGEIQIFKPGEKERMVFLDEDPDAAAVQAPEEDVSRDSHHATPVIIKANRVIVPVILGYEGRKIETSLVFDTGAGSIVLHQDVADNLGIIDSAPAIGRGVGGIEIDAKVARLQSIKVGPYEKRNLRVAIVAYQGEPVEGYHGLLGMNFLRGLKYEIDFENQMIVWGGGAGAFAE